ncbi:MAG: DUF3426 domain-containing protein [Thermodesulfobacteriota bacterium]
MIITCEKCGGSFKLDEKLIKPGGTKMQCSKCRHIFRAYPPGGTSPSKGPSDIELITCEKCGAGFKMKSSLLKPDGSKVRCSKCQHIFLAYSSSATPGAVKPEAETAKPAAPAKPKKVAPAPSFEPESVDDTAVFADEMDLDLEEKPKKAESKASDAMDLELELDEDEAGGDLDLDLEEKPKKAESKASDDMDLELELDEDEAGGDLDLDLEEKPKKAESEASDDMDLELDLDEEDSGEDLELDLEEKPKKEKGKAAGAPKKSSGDEEIDFSEVDDLLESEDVSVADTVEVSSHDLGLSLDEDDDSGGGVEQQEIDLADLEQTIEMELLEPEEESDREEAEDVELALADDDEEEDEEEESLSEGDGDDFSDIEEMLSSGDDEETIELDLEGEEDKEKEEAGKAEEAEESAAKGKKAKAAKKVKEKKVKAEKEPGEKKSLKKVIILALVILLVLIGLGVGFVFKDQILPLIGMGQKAPAGSGTPVVMDNTMTDFVDNAKSGKLFIIKGSVKNESAESKRFIRVVANLYSAGRKLEMTSSAYCGNILTNEELATAELAAINNRLAVQAGDNNRNADVKPGMTIPFMIVINQMPGNLEEYEVKVSESAPVK